MGTLYLCSVDRDCDHKVWSISAVSQSRGAGIRPYRRRSLGGVTVFSQFGLFDAECGDPYIVVGPWFCYVGALFMGCDPRPLCLIYECLLINMVAYCCTPAQRDWRTGVAEASF